MRQHVEHQAQRACLARLGAAVVVVHVVSGLDRLCIRVRPAQNRAQVLPHALHEALVVLPLGRVAERSHEAGVEPE